jgi:alanine-glyoxylate transaminase/(R)-3-amino-2-methylpropionate-pyruvate transaminase
MALMLARAYTGNYDLVCLRNGYHGMSMETMGMCGQHTWKQPLPQGFGIRHAMNPDPYRGPFGNDGLRCVDKLPTGHSSTVKLSLLVLIPI